MSAAIQGLMQVDPQTVVLFGAVLLVTCYLKPEQVLSRVRQRAMLQRAVRRRHPPSR